MAGARGLYGDLGKVDAILSPKPSAQLPMFWIAPSVETGNHHDPRFFYEEKEPVREPTHSGPPPSFVHYRIMHRAAAIASTVSTTASANRCASSGRMLSCRANASLSFASASGSQTTGSVTAS
jgi:hypothetical protein